MEEPDSIDSDPTSDYPQKRLVTEPSSVLIQNQTNSGKFLSNFVCKSIFVVILVALLPFLSSQAPELFADAFIIRIWDLVHLLLVGVAISYGLFSRKNTESDKETRLKNDSDHAYAARILQISSVFEDEIESPLSFSDNKMGSWSSMYVPEEPDVIFEENSYGDSVGSRKKIRNKTETLSLPVRRLKSRLHETESQQNANEFYESINRSSSGLRGTSSTEVLDSKGSGDFIFEQMKMEEEEKASVVLPSPIPWRSRSGRVKEVKDGLLKSDRIKNEQESQKSRSNITRSTIHLATGGSTSPKELSPCPSMEPHATIFEDYVKKKKKIYATSSSSSPPPPPPPPPVDWRHSSTNAKSSTHRDEKRLKNKSSKDKLKNFSTNQSNAASEEVLSINSPSTKEKSKAIIDIRIPGKSVSTIRSSDSLSDGTGLTKEYEQYEKKTPDRIISAVTEDSKNKKSDEEEAEDGDVNEVNKKADEFIAKFREQIRLQRIESIKRSSEQRIAKKSR